MVEVTDEMVERFRQVSGPYLGLPKPPSGALLSDQAIRAWKKEAARGILEKTLNPQTAPQEPEIVVTEEMLKTGVEVFRAPRHQPEPETSLAAAYRAMRRLEPPQGVSPERRKAQAKVLRMYERTDDSGMLKYVAHPSRSTDAPK